jgi:hypothetical protein
MVVITVEDDGAGLDRARILAKAQELGLEADAGWSDADVWRLVFAPGFSTSSEITDVSGRGVGMDVVRRNVEALGGSVEIDSIAGKGATLTIRLPLTLAIVDGMSVSVDGDVHIVPLANIEQSLRPDGGAGKHRRRAIPCWTWAARTCPSCSSTKVSPRATRPTKASSSCSRPTAAARRLRIDDVLGQHQVVLKSLETTIARCPASRAPPSSATAACRSSSTRRTSSAAPTAREGPMQAAMAQRSLPEDCVLARTPEGSRRMRDRAAGLPARLRSVLFLVDGSQPVRRILARRASSVPLLEEQLMELSTWDCSEGARASTGPPPCPSWARRSSCSTHSNAIPETA